MQPWGCSPCPKLSLRMMSKPTGSSTDISPLLKPPGKPFLAAASRVTTFSHPFPPALINHTLFNYHLVISSPNPFQILPLSQLLSTLLPCSLHSSAVRRCPTTGVLSRRGAMCPTSPLLLPQLKYKHCSWKMIKCPSLSGQLLRILGEEE